MNDLNASRKYRTWCQKKNDTTTNISEENTCTEAICKTIIADIWSDSETRLPVNFVDGNDQTVYYSKR